MRSTCQYRWARVERVVELVSDGVTMLAACELVAQVYLGPVTPFDTWTSEERDQHALLMAYPGCRVTQSHWDRPGEDVFVRGRIEGPNWPDAGLPEVETTAKHARAEVRARAHVAGVTWQHVLPPVGADWRWAMIQEDIAAAPLRRAAMYGLP